MNGRLLVAGFSTRHIAASARRAGYGVVAVDHFCDLDLEETADSCLRFETLAPTGRANPPDFHVPSAFATFRFVEIL